MVTALSTVLTGRLDQETILPSDGHRMCPLITDVEGITPRRFLDQLFDILMSKKPPQNFNELSLGLKQAAVEAQCLHSQRLVR